MVYFQIVQDMFISETQTHQHLKCVTEKVVAPIVATGYTDPNTSDMQRIEFEPDRDFQVYQGVRYRLATTQQADAVQPNLDKKGKKISQGHGTTCLGHWFE